MDDDDDDDDGFNAPLPDNYVMGTTGSFADDQHSVAVPLGVNPKTDAELICERERALLSEQERTELHDDMYGTSKKIKETEKESEEFVIETLQQLEVAIHDIKNEKLKKPYYAALEQEEEQGTNYVKSKKFRLMFLRAEKFCVQNAALRLVRFFGHKLKLFGATKLPHPIKQTDLKEEEQKILHSGFMTIDTNLDKNGRSVLVCRQQNFVHHNDNDMNSLKRAIFYLWQSSVENNDHSQKTGFIWLMYGVGSIDVNALDVRRVFSRVRKFLFLSLPFKVACLHNCYSQTSIHVISSFMLYLMPRDIKLRYTLHYGSHEKCRFELSKYGLNVDSLPVSMDGEYNFKQLCAWLEELSKGENENEELETEGQEKTQKKKIAKRNAGGATA